MRAARSRLLSVAVLTTLTTLAACGGSKSQPVVADVVVSRSNLFFTAVGQSARLTAAPVFASGVVGADAPITWTSSAPDQVGVDPTGVVSANAIGSAQIFAEANGVRSLPTFVVVAEPVSGALLLTDAQVQAVGAPLNLDPSALPSIGTQYEVRVTGVSPPPGVGTPVLAMGDAPVAGTVVSTRDDAGTLVLTLQLAPLHQLLGRYHIDFDIDLGQYPSQDLAAFADSTSTTPPPPAWPQWPPPPAAAAGLEWVRPAGASTLKNVVKQFHAFECDPSLKGKILKQEVSLNESGTINYIVQDHRDDPSLPPGYVLRKLVGTLTAEGKVGIKLDAGFDAKLDCRAQKAVYIKCFGWLSLAFMPAIRFGVGSTLEGSLQIGQAELSIDGKVGGNYEIGWECAPPAPCTGIGNVTPVEEVKPKFITPDLSAMRLKLAGTFYGLLGLDAAFGAGKLGHASLVEARGGPKQSIDLGFESDQATEQAYASTFDLKLTGVVEPGSGIQDALKKDIDDSGVSLKFSLTAEKPLAESPKGTFSVDKHTPNIGEEVTLTVDLDPKTVDYGLLGYQPMSIEIYRLADGDTQYKPFKCTPPTSPLQTCTITVSASNQTHFETKWKVTDQDAGTNTLAAFVRTIFSDAATSEAHVPYEEIAVNTQQQVQVPCFSGGPVPAAPAGIFLLPGRSRYLAVCADQWNASLTYDSGPPPGTSLSLVHHTANLTFVRNPAAFDPTGLEPQWVATSGTLGVRFTDPDPSCTIDVQPSGITFPTGYPLEYTFLGIDYSQDPPFFSFAVSDIVALTATETCPDHSGVTPLPSYIFQIDGAGHLVTPTDTSIVGQSTAADGTVVTWSFTR